jgi:hypothetical protein
LADVALGVDLWHPAGMRLIWSLLWVGLFAGACPDHAIGAEENAAEGEFNHFTNLSGEAWCKANVEEARKHFELWKSAKGDQREREAEMVRFYAWRGQLKDLLVQVISDGRLAETEVKPPEEVTTVPVQVKLEVPEDPMLGWGGESAVWRRITPGAYEVWTPHHGWLFNAAGDLVQTAEPPRDEDCAGRQWHGAFLPDGRWITTELHEGDGRVYIFDRKGHCTHEIKSGALLKEGPYHPASAEPMIIPWARSNKSGDAWLMRIGSEEGLGESLLEADGSWHRRPSSVSIWRECMKRKLGVRLRAGICIYSVESDDGGWELGSFQPGHGSGVGNPVYQFSKVGRKVVDEEHPVGLGNIPGNGDEFGFWPDSHATWVRGEARTWFFDAGRKFTGWIAGDQIGDATEGKGMIFRFKDGKCITVYPSLKTGKGWKFVLPDGRVLLPLDLQPDMGLGMFALFDPGEVASELTTNADVLQMHPHLMLARWKAGPH